jgi:hypothetical protein
VHNHEHKVNIFKAKTYKKDYASVLALIECGRKVSFGEAWRILGVDSVRTYAT